MPERSRQLDDHRDRSTKDAALQAKHINTRICRAADAGDIEGLLNIIASKRAELTCVNLSTALHKLARLRKEDTLDRQLAPDARQLMVLRARTQQVLEGQLADGPNGEALPRCWATIAWAYGSLQFRDEDVSRTIRIIGQLSLPHIGSFKPFELTNLLWAFAKIQESGKPLCLAAKHHIEANLSGFTSSNLATLVWAFATLGFLPSGFLYTLAEEFATRLPREDVNPVELSNLLWGLATVKLHPKSRLLRDVGGRAVQILPAFKLQELSITAWAISRLSARHDDFFQAVAKRLRSNVQLRQQVHPQGAANLLWAFERQWSLGSSAAPEIMAAVRALVPTCQRLLPYLKPQEYVCVLRSITKLGFKLGQRPEVDQLFDSAAGADQQYLYSLSALQCVNLVEAFACFVQDAKGVSSDLSDRLPDLVRVGMLRIQEVGFIGACDANGARESSHDDSRHVIFMHHALSLVTLAPPTRPDLRKRLVSQLAHCALQHGLGVLNTEAQGQLGVLCGLQPGMFTAEDLRSVVAQAAHLHSQLEQRGRVPAQSMVDRNRVASSSSWAQPNANPVFGVWDQPTDFDDDDDSRMNPSLSAGSSCFGQSRGERLTGGWIQPDQHMTGNEFIESTALGRTLPHGVDYGIPGGHGRSATFAGPGRGYGDGCAGVGFGGGSGVCGRNGCGANCGCSGGACDIGGKGCGGCGGEFESFPGCAGYVDAGGCGGCYGGSGNGDFGGCGGFGGCRGSDGYGAKGGCGACGCSDFGGGKGCRGCGARGGYSNPCGGGGAHSDFNDCTGYGCGGCGKACCMGCGSCGGGKGHEGCGACGGCGVRGGCGGHGARAGCDAYGGCGGCDGGRDMGCRTSANCYAGGQMGCLGGGSVENGMSEASVGFDSYRGGYGMKGGGYNSGFASYGPSGCGDNDMGCNGPGGCIGGKGCGGFVSNFNSCPAGKGCGASGPGSGSYIPVENSVSDNFANPREFQQMGPAGHSRASAPHSMGMNASPTLPSHSFGPHTRGPKNAQLSAHLERSLQSGCQSQREREQAAAFQAKLESDQVAILRAKLERGQSPGFQLFPSDGATNLGMDPHQGRQAAEFHLGDELDHHLSLSNPQPGGLHAFQGQFASNHRMAPTGSHLEGDHSLSRSAEFTNIEHEQVSPFNAQFESIDRDHSDAFRLPFDNLSADQGFSMRHSVSYEQTSDFQTQSGPNPSALRGQFDQAESSAFDSHFVDVQPELLHPRFEGVQVADFHQPLEADEASPYHQVFEPERPQHVHRNQVPFERDPDTFQASTFESGFKQPAAQLDQVTSSENPFEEAEEQDSVCGTNSVTSAYLVKNTFIEGEVDGEMDRERRRLSASRFWTEKPRPLPGHDVEMQDDLIQDVLEMPRQAAYASSVQALLMATDSNAAVSRGGQRPLSPGRAPSSPLGPDLGYSVGSGGSGGACDPLGPSELLLPATSTTSAPIGVSSIQPDLASTLGSDGAYAVSSTDPNRSIGQATGVDDREGPGIRLMAGRFWSEKPRQSAHTLGCGVFDQTQEGPGLRLAERRFRSARTDSKVSKTIFEDVAHEEEEEEEEEEEAADMSKPRANDLGVRFADPPLRESSEERLPLDLMSQTRMGAVDSADSSYSTSYDDTSTQQASVTDVAQASTRPQTLPYSDLPTFSDYELPVSEFGSRLYACNEQMQSSGRTGSYVVRRTFVEAADDGELERARLAASRFISAPMYNEGAPHPPLQ